MSAFKQGIPARLRAASVCMFLLLGASPCALAGEGQRSVLRGALDQPVEVHGALNYDAAGSGKGAMMYPAAGLAGLLVAIAAHAVISNGVRDAEKQKLRDAADQVLAPHQEMLKGYKNVDLLMDAAPLVTAAGQLRVLDVSSAAAADEVLIDSLPMFYLTQDRRALIMENAIIIRRGGQLKPYEGVIRVVSAARDADTGAAFWFDENANGLRQISARMLAESVDIALKDTGAESGAASVFKTVRYNEGGTERMERAQIVGTTCTHLVLRTLRGNLMVVPRKPGAEPQDPGCQSAQAS